MPTVVLLVTGRLEELALASSLKRQFPTAAFETQRLDSFTSARLPNNLPASEEPRQVDKLAAALVAAVDPGRRGTPADLAVAVEDLELTNMDQPDLVVRHFREAVVRHVEQHWSTLTRRQLCFDRLRKRCSFHMTVPMVEAVFFSDPGVVATAGAKRAPAFDPATCDVEQFVTSDSDFIKPNDGSFDWAKPDRARHPKRYLQFLCDPDGTLPRRKRYRESEGGKRALESLDWLTVVKHSEHARFARAMLRDIADALGEDASRFGDSVYPATGGVDSVLRNA